jgi:alpha-galactosidase
MQKFCSMPFALLLLLASAGSFAHAQQPQTKPPQQTLAATPPMGWNSWNYFADKVDDKGVRAAADLIVSSGMRDAGYVYVNIDDTWEGERDASGVLHPNSKFPDMKALADYVHSKGLKLGIYSSPGPKTCAGFEGSLGHEQQDATMYAAWGVDYLKYDLCSYIDDVMHKQAPQDEAAQMQLMRQAYTKMQKALQSTNRPIVYSFCQYGWDASWEWAAQTGANLWRTTGDIEANWQSMYSIAQQQTGLKTYAGPGHWNDPDMLEVGNGKLTLSENQAHFSLWAILAAPLLAGNDLPNMSKDVSSVLTNKDVIAVNQDKLGRQGGLAYSEGEVDVWTRPLADGGVAVLVINLGPNRTANHPFVLNLKRIGLSGNQPARDLWLHQSITLHEQEPLTLKRHGLLMVRLNAPHVQQTAAK